jgi:hypothetical protein
MAEEKTDEERGLYQKYRVERINDAEGKHDDCFFFVLDVHHDPFAMPALLEYIKLCRGKYPLLANDLLHALREIPAP